MSVCAILRLMLCDYIFILNIFYFYTWMDNAKLICYYYNCISNTLLSHNTLTGFFSLYIYSSNILHHLYAHSFYPTSCSNIYYGHPFAIVQLVQHEFLFALFLLSISFTCDLMLFIFTCL